MNELRHELKYLCSYEKLDRLQKLLFPFLSLDEHHLGDAYHVKSLYLDTALDRFLFESLSGVPQRRKYRLRRYNSETEKIKFEEKSSLSGLKCKNVVWLDRKTTLDLLSDNPTFPVQGQSVLEEFYYLKQKEKITPKVVIEYDRTALIDKNLNIRITFDKNISRSSVDSFFCNTSPSSPLFEKNMGILEVKFNSVFPIYLKKILNQEDLTQVSLSKYEHGRLMKKV